MTTKLTSNYPGYSANDIPTNQKYITLRTAQDDPMSWAEFDNNFELLRYSVNSLVDDIAVVREDVDYGAEIAVINENIQSNYSTLDARFNDYLTVAVADTTYLKKSDEIDAYTKTEVDTNFAAKNDLNDYVQTTVLDDYVQTTVLDDYVTGDELTTFGQSYALSTDVPDAYTKQESDARYYQGTPSGGGGEWENVAVQVAQGELYETSESIIEQIASANVIALREAITAAICDNNTAQTEPQTFTGCVRLPAGRIYLNERIVITMPATLGHNLPNSITIEGVGQGNTQLCWTNNASSFGILIEQGPYGATMSQRIVVRDLDFIMGYQGLNNGSGVGAPANQTEGLLYARGTALEVTGDRLDIGVSGATSTHAELTGYDKTPGHGLKPNTIVENCNFMGWHWSYAGWDKCIVYEDSQLSDIKGCCFTGAVIDTGDGKPWATSKSAIHITGDAKCTDYYLTENRFFGFEYGILCDGNIEGVTIQHSTWVNTHHGIWWAVEKIGGGQPAYDPDTNTFTSGSTDGTSISGVAQWPLLVVTDCHINALETCIHIHNGWQIMIKGCSFYGINIAQSYGTGHGFNAYHKSINIDNQSSNVMITANTFSDVSNTTSATDGGYGPSIDIDGHFNLVDGNTFTRDGNRDEPHVRLSGRASGNTVQNNTVITSLAQNWADGGVPVSVIPGNLLNLHIEDNNTGTYNGVAIHTNRKLNNS